MKHCCEDVFMNEELNENLRAGDAIDVCYGDDKGNLWVTNYEYGSRVNYCPYCGFKAKNQMEKYEL